MNIEIQAFQSASTAGMASVVEDKMQKIVKFQSASTAGMASDLLFFSAALRQFQSASTAGMASDENAMAYRAIDSFNRHPLPEWPQTNT